MRPMIKRGVLKKNSLLTNATMAVAYVTTKLPCFFLVGRLLTKNVKIILLGY